MADSKMEMLIVRLLEKSKAGTIAWESIAGGGFQVAFPRYSVRVLSRPSEAEDEFDYGISLHGEDGTLL